MFENVKNILNKFEKALNNLKLGFNDDEDDVREYREAENTMDYFELHLAEELMKNSYINAKRVAQIILATKEE